MVGDVMVDVFELLGAARGRAACSTGSGVERGGYLLATAHRAGNVDDPARLRALVDVLDRRAAARSCCRCTRARARGWRPRGCWTRSTASSLAPPLGYLEFTALLLRRARGADRLRRRPEGGVPGRACRA